MGIVTTPYHAAVIASLTTSKMLTGSCVRERQFEGGNWRPIETLTSPSLPSFVRTDVVTQTPSPRLTPIPRGRAMVKIHSFSFCSALANSYFCASQLAPLLLSFLPAVIARLVNVTVDDSGSDPFSGAKIVYAPDGHWSQGNTCAGCWAQPDSSQAYNKTWHDATYDFISPNRSSVVQTATFPFTGAICRSHY